MTDTESWFDGRVVKVPYPVSENQDDDPMLRTLTEIETYCVERERDLLSDSAIKTTAKARQVHAIQGARVEIYCITTQSKKPKTFFDEICDHLVTLKIYPNIKERSKMEKQLFSNVYQRAKVGVDKMNNSGYQHTPDQLSLIVSFGQVKGQQLHYDMKAPNIQFVMAVSDRVPATQAARFVSNQELDTVDKIKSLAYGGQRLSKSILALLKKNAEAKEWIKTYGNLLRMNHWNGKLEHTPMTRLKRGDVMCMMGSTMHYGPPSIRTRVAWFGVAYPITVPATVPYNRDFQLTPATFACTIANLIWTKCKTEDQSLIVAFLTPFVINALSESHPSFRVSHHFDASTSIRPIIESIETTYFLTIRKQPRIAIPCGLDSPNKVEAFTQEKYTLLDTVYDHSHGLNEAPFSLYMNRRVKDKNLNAKALCCKNITERLDEWINHYRKQVDDPLSIREKLFPLLQMKYNGISDGRKRHAWLSKPKPGDTYKLLFQHNSIPSLEIPK